MADSNIKATFSCEIEKVWNKVVSLEDYSWRSDLDNIKVIKKKKEFIEYTKDGYATRFIITTMETCRRYEFDMENDTMSGHWTGLFAYQNGKTTIDFTEHVTAKKLFMKPLWECI